MKFARKLQLTYCHRNFSYVLARAVHEMCPRTSNSKIFIGNCPKIRFSKSFPAAKLGRVYGKTNELGILYCPAGSHILAAVGTLKQSQNYAITMKHALCAPGSSYVLRVQINIASDGDWCKASDLASSLHTYSKYKTRMAFLRHWTHK